MMMKAIMSFYCQRGSAFSTALSGTLRENRLRAGFGLGRVPKKRTENALFTSRTLMMYLRIRSSAPAPFLRQSKSIILRNQALSPSCSLKIVDSIYGQASSGSHLLEHSSRSRSQTVNTSVKKPFRPGRNKYIGLLLEAKMFDRCQLNDAIHIMKGMCRAQSDFTAIQTAHQIFQKVLDSATSPDLLSVPKLQKGWTCIIRGYAKMNRASNSSNVRPFLSAYELLLEMMKRHNNDPEYSPSPEAHHYVTVLQACAFDSASDQAVELAESLVATLEEDNLVTLDMYNVLLLLHANRAPTVYGAAAAAEDWLMHISKRASNDEEGKCPPLETGSFNCVLKAWCNSPEEKGARHALDMLQLMQSLGPKSLQPDPISFGLIIAGFARRKQPEECQAVLQEAIKYFGSDMYIPKAEDVEGVDLTQCWNMVCKSWARNCKDKKQAAKQVHKLITAAECVESDRYFVLQTEEMYRAWTDAYVKGGDIERAHALVLHMIHMFVRDPAVNRNLFPTTQTFCLVIQAWYDHLSGYEAKLSDEERKSCGTAAKYHGVTTRVTDLLSTMLQYSERYAPPLDCRPTPHIFWICVDLWVQTRKAYRTELANTLDKSECRKLAVAARSAIEEAAKNLELAETRRLALGSSYASVIEGLCKTNHYDCIMLAAKMLEGFVRETDNGKFPIPPYMAELHVTVIAALGRMGNREASTLAFTILAKIRSCSYFREQSTMYHYFEILKALSNFRDNTSARIAFDLFEELSLVQGSQRIGSVSLETRLCLEILQALASGKDGAAAVHSLEVIQWMLNQHISGRDYLEPWPQCFEIAMSTILKHGESSEIIKAAQVLQKASQVSIEKVLKKPPSSTVYQAVIEGCKTIGTMESNQIAGELFVWSKAVSPKNAITETFK
jgi:hypothetical protein